VIVLLVNIVGLCLYRCLHKKQREEVMRGVVNQEVSKYFKIA